MAQGLFNLKQVNQAVQQGAWPNLKTSAVDYLVVGGGGGSGNTGGGAGGVFVGSTPVPTGSSITVTVGAGGAAGSNGDASVFGQISVIGGGYGAGNSGQPAGSGASGGGGFNNNRPGQGTTNLGFMGGLSLNTTGGGAGGGAGNLGQGGDSNGNVGGYGGPGVGTYIGGALATYGGGGSGAGSTTNGKGGVGGGGDGDVNGAANTGGGAGAYVTSGHSGGSGVVVVSYPDVYAAATSTTGSPTVTTSGSGSVSFNGAGTQSINYAGQTPFSLGTGDFTIEGWVQVNSTAGTNFIVDFRNGSTTNSLTIYTGTTSLIYYDPTVNQLTLGTISAGTWYHFAVSRTGTTLKTFFNGTQITSTTDAQNLAVGSDRPVIGGYGPDPSQSSLNGYVSNLRIVKGTGLYTASFTPSTTPLTVVSGTSLLLNTISGAYLADGSTNSYAGILRGTPTWASASPFTVTGYKNRVYKWTSSGSITF